MVSRWLLFFCTFLVPSFANAEYIYVLPDEPTVAPPLATTPRCEVCPGCGDCMLCGHKPVTCTFHDGYVTRTMAELREIADRLGDMCAESTIDDGFDDPRAALDELIELGNRVFDLVRAFQVDKSLCPCSTADDQGVFDSLMRLIQVRHDCVYDAVSYSPPLEPEDELQPASPVMLN
jgi:hypothetical protein